MWKKKTLAEMFAHLLQRGEQRFDLWRTIRRAWNDNDVLEVTTAGDESLRDALCEAMESEDANRILVLCDQAEEAGVNPELCDLTRRAVRAQYSE